jgi:hypothetical protein
MLDPVKDPMIVRDKLSCPDVLVLEVLSLS